MADVSKIKLPDGTTYNIKDTVSGYITANTAPVTSVNGDIGDVTITEGLEPLIGTTATVTPQQVMTALEEGRDICIEADTTFVLLSLKLKFTDFNRATDNLYSGAAVDIVVSQTIVNDSGNWYVFTLTGGTMQGQSIPWTVNDTQMVPASRTINGNTLDGNITLNYSDVNAVPTTRTVNNKVLSSDITLNASDVGAVPTTRKVNNKVLSSDITLDANDVGALPDSTIIPSKTSDLTNDSGFITGYTETDPTVPSWAKASTKPTYTASEVGAIPVSRTINGKALSNDITLDASDIGINPASVAPNMDGTAAVGTSSKYAREDHVHPTDTSRQADLGLTSADVKKWNNGIKIVHGSDVGYITGSSIVYNDNTIDYKINYTTDGGTTTSEITLVESNSLNYMGHLFAQSFVPKTTTINGNALSSNITLDADDVSAIPASAKGAASGVAPLDANSKVDSQYLPSYLIKGNTGGVFYGTCSTAAGTVAKVVKCADFTADNLKAGAIIIVSFSATNSGAVANLTMNVNSTGAKPIKYINNGTLGNLSSAGYLKANTEYPFYYDGANWVCWFNVNTTYSALSEADMHTGTATTARLITAQRLKQAVQYHAPVTSVNGNTGAVTVTVPTKTSELTNNGEDGSSGFVTGNDVTDLVDFSLLSPTFCATDATTQAVLQQAFGASAEIVVPSNITSTTLLLHKLEPRTWFCWMNGAEMEFARMSVSVNTGTSAITLYLRGRTSIATGIMGVDSSWMVTPLASDAEGVAY